VNLLKKIENNKKNRKKEKGKKLNLEEIGDLRNDTIDNKRGF
jgi:hypothetical protein